MTFRRFLRVPLATLLGLSLLASLACGGKSSGPSQSVTPPLPADIAEALRVSPGVSGVTEVTSTLPGTRFFRFKLTQAVDHTVNGGPTFQQTLTLLYRSRTAPVVLATTGYAISLNPGQGEPTRILNANQITMEHRFFNASTPVPTDWSKLTIQQAAADEHQVVVALKPIFRGKWVNTGGSKGGMTALFHRRFYPEDVDATLAYVAPINLGNPDARYIPFVDARGDAPTRLALEAWQQAIFNKRAEVLALLQADGAARGATFNLLGADRTLEFAVLESPFVIWQYGTASLAAQVPPANATAQALYAYLDQVNGGVVNTWSDSTLTYYQAYYHQCATQLGYPAVKDSHLSGIAYSGQDIPALYPPAGVAKTYAGTAAMQDIQSWLTNSAQRVILVYGENDPWTAGALDVPAGAQARGIRKYLAPAGNHGSKLASLLSSDASEAYNLLGQWLNAPVVPVASGPAQPLRQGEVPEPDLADTFVVRRGGR